VLQLPEVRTRLSGDGAEPVGNTPEEFAAYMRAETLKWTKVVKDSDIRAD
jgi:tripartite-type tricarboxylate transporter receptor subunit TctC